MVLESTMICFDNSEDMRNGDFSPSRMQAQQEGANMLIQCKLRSNPENAVGLLSMADRVNVLTTLTTDNNKLFIKLHQIQPDGYAKFLTALKIAHLALKHRQNRNHKARIILFVGSLMEEDDGELIKTAKKFKKEKVNVDIVCFGDEANTNHEKLKSFLETLNGKDGTGSHMIAVPPGSDLQQALMSSPIVRGEDGGGAAIAAHGAGFFEVDPNDDPELALALRVSLEEQRARQEQQAAAAAAASATEQQAPGGSGAAAVVAPPAPSQPSAPRTFDQMTEDEQIALALQMSLEQTEGQAAATGEGRASPKPAPKVEPMDTGEKSVDAEMAEGSTSASDDIGELMSDPTALQALVSTLPGVDPNSEAVQQALAQAVAEGASKQAKPGPKKGVESKSKDKKDDRK